MTAKYYINAKLELDFFRLLEWKIVIEEFVLLLTRDSKRLFFCVICPDNRGSLSTWNFSVLCADFGLSLLLLIFFLKRGLLKIVLYTYSKL